MKPKKLPRRRWRVEVWWRAPGVCSGYAAKDMWRTFWLLKNAEKYADSVWGPGSNILVYRNWKRPYS